MKLSIRLRMALAGLALLWLAGCGGTEQAQKTKVHSNLLEALREAQNGNTREARKWADRAIAVSPEDVLVYVSPQTSSMFNPDAENNAPELSVADVFTFTGDDATLADYMKQAQRKFPQSEMPLAPLVQAEDRLGDTAGRIAAARQLASLLEARIAKPKTIPSALLLNQLAQAYFDAGNTAKGAETYHRVITTFAFDPNADDARNNLAYAWAVANDTAHLPEALTLAAKALARARELARQNKMQDESVGAVQDTLGWVEYRMKNYPAALSDLQQAMNADPREAVNRYHLGMAYKATGDTDAARAEFERARLISPQYAAPQKELVLLPAIK